MATCREYGLIEQEMLEKMTAAVVCMLHSLQISMDRHGQKVMYPHAVDTRDLYVDTMTQMPESF